MAHPPAALQSVLWSVNVNRLDLKKDKVYIIHQVLIYGTLEEILWLFQTYSKPEVVRVFLQQPAKLYPQKIYIFIKNHLLGLPRLALDAEDYVTSIFGPVRPRAANRI